ncbi:MAG: 30S ribosomal protein S20, partial [Candidatus Omnitrophica bacterium]|nr:30S ribosomal protein S20 [Candidatus Omnitrophota bacterium]
GIRQTKKRYMRNKTIISELRTVAKKANLLIESKKKQEADAVLKEFESKLYRAVKTKKIKKNNASRRISRLRQQWAKIDAKKQ